MDFSATCHYFRDEDIEEGLFRSSADKPRTSAVNLQKRVPDAAEQPSVIVLDTHGRDRQLPRKARP